MTRFSALSPAVIGSSIEQTHAHARWRQSDGTPSAAQVTTLIAASVSSHEAKKKTAQFMEICKKMQLTEEHYG